MLPNPAHLLGQPRFPEVTEAPDHEAAAKTPGDRAIHSRGSQIALGVTATRLAADAAAEDKPEGCTLKGCTLEDRVSEGTRQRP